MNKSVSSCMTLCLATLFLATLFLPKPISTEPPPVAAESAPGATLLERGDSYEIWDNGDGTYMWISAPQWVWNGEEYVPYVYEDHYGTDGYHQVQKGLIGAKIFDYYAVFFNPTMSEVRLHDERWEVEQWRPKQERWDAVGAQSGTPTFNVITNSSGVFITKTFTSWAGTLEIQYVFRDGSPLKHNVVWTSSLTETAAFRVLQKWSGIVGDRVKHQRGVEVISTATTINSSWFRFEKADGSLSVFEDQWSMYYEVDPVDPTHVRLKTDRNLKPVTVDLHAQGLKADFVFGSWTLNRGESLIVDPTTTTLTPPLADTYVSGDHPDTNYGSSTLLAINWRTSQEQYSLVKFDLSSIPSGSTIDSANLSIYLYAYPGDGGAGHTHLAQRINSSWAENTVTWNTKPTTNSTNQASTTVPSSAEKWQNWTVTGIVADWVENGETNHGFLLRDQTTGSGNKGGYYRSKEYDGNDPKLTVTYSPAQYNYLTTYLHTGCDKLYVNGTQTTNGTQTQFTPGQTANITTVVGIGFKWHYFDKYIYDSSNTTKNPFYLVMDQNYTVHAYAEGKVLDDFNDNSVDDSKWELGSFGNPAGPGIQETNQTLQITTQSTGGYRGHILVSDYNLSLSSTLRWNLVTITIPSPSTTLGYRETVFALINTYTNSSDPYLENDWLRVALPQNTTGTRLILEKKVSGGPPVLIWNSSDTFDPSFPKTSKIGFYINNSTLYFYWNNTEQCSVFHGLNFTEYYVYFYTRVTTSESRADEFDDLKCGCNGENKHAIGSEGEKRLGVRGWNKVFDPDLVDWFTAEYLTIYDNKDDWINVGWIKGTAARGLNTGGVIKFYVEWEVDGTWNHIFHVPASPSTNHKYEINSSGSTWYAYVDDAQIFSGPLNFQNGTVYAESEVGNDCNTLDGVYWKLEYRDATGWHVWTTVYTTARAPYCSAKVGDNAFLTDGPYDSLE